MSVDDACTWEEFLRLPEDDRRELIDGRLVDLDDPNYIPRGPLHHAWMMSALIMILQEWAQAVGAIVLAHGYPLRPGSHLAPDLQLHLNPRRLDPDTCEYGLVGALPDMVAEIITPDSARRDRVARHRDYASIGCPEYWLIDPESRLLEQFVLDGEHYRLAARPSEDAVFEPETFPGLKVPLSTLWALPGGETSTE